MTKAPPLRDDCFAMPRGVDWTPVSVALDRLQAGLSCVVAKSDVPVRDALGRILASDVIAVADHPPFKNSAVDGYGFAHVDLPVGDEVSLSLVKGRATAGPAFSETVPPGHAIRILTGAAVPDGVDTVVLQEDVNVDASHIYFRAGLKRNANTRPRGEDIEAGDVVLEQGRRLRPADLGVLASAGVAQVTVCDPLRVAVLTTGNELTDVIGTPKAGQIYDANRPMLLAQIQQWGHHAIDIGIVPDDAALVKEALNRAADEADIILTTGGASSGDEDHISKLLVKHANLQTWRIAVKPGRPLAMALWNGVPVFGLPGNPVAAMVCTQIFAQPACRVLSGQSWQLPSSMNVPAAFAKSKKEGRTEYLRARLNAAGHAETFQSEGSGRISGLSWADGLIELGDEAQQIELGDMVRFIPFR